MLGKYGGRTWARTKDPLIKSQLLYQLSYASTLPFQQPPESGEALHIAVVSGEGSPLAHEIFSRVRELLRQANFSAQRVVIHWLDLDSAGLLKMPYTA